MTSNVANEVVFEVETGIHRPSGLAKITIPNYILKRLSELRGQGIFKLSILETGTEIFFEYRVGKKVEIVSRMIPRGKFTASIKPYTIDDFIHEFNEKIKREFNLSLSLEDNILILKTGEAKLTTSKWSFYKETGGGAAIKAEYTSSQRRNKRLFIKYQVKFGTVSIYLLEPQGRRSRLSTQKIVGISYNERRGLLLFKYRHGNRVKTTFADLYPRLEEDRREEDEDLVVLRKEDEWELVVQTVLRRGRDYEIVIPKRIFEELKVRWRTEIFKLIIRGEKLEIEYIWKLSMNREQEISIKDLDSGTYRVLIKPYYIEDFIREFNLKAEGKYGLRLAIQNKILILSIDGKTLETVNWTFDREFGGGAYIKAVYPSEIRKSREIIIKYQVKRGRASLWILEPRNNRRPAVYPIQYIEVEGDRISIIYRHGRRMKTTYILFNK